VSGPTWPEPSGGSFAGAFGWVIMPPGSGMPINDAIAHLFLEPFAVCPSTGMPRYFSAPTMTSCISITMEEFADKHAAWKEATRLPDDMIKDIDGKRRPGHDWKLEVEDELRT
jgi:hypothetical protein